MDIARHARHIALPEIGPEGQARITAARVAVVGADLAAETAALYLKAAGVGQVIWAEEEQGGSEKGRENPEPQRISVPPFLPVNNSGSGTSADTWLAVLSNVDLVVRSGFDDDAMAGAAARLGLPVIVVRAQRDGVDLVAFARRPPAPDATAAAPYAAATPPDNGPAAVLAGTLAAAEALHVLARGNEPQAPAPPPIRHLRLPLDGREPMVQAIGRQP